MEIEVNNQIGKLVNSALYEQFAAAGHVFPQLPVCPLWEVIEAICRFAGPRTTPQELEDALNGTPEGTYLWLIEATMSVSARIKPNDAASVAGTVTFMQGKLADYGCQFTPAECDKLTAQLEPLVALPRSPDVMWALGATLLHQVTCNLPGVSNRQDKRRRESFLLKGEKACKSIERTPNRADCRSLASRLAEQLDRELYLSRSTQRSWAVNCFWLAFELIDVRLYK